MSVQPRYVVHHEGSGVAPWSVYDRETAKTVDSLTSRRMARSEAACWNAGRYEPTPAPTAYTVEAYHQATDRVLWVEDASYPTEDAAAKNYATLYQMLVKSLDPTEYALRIVAKV